MVKRCKVRSSSGFQVKDPSTSVVEAMIKVDAGARAQNEAADVEATARTEAVRAIKETVVVVTQAVARFLPVCLAATKSSHVARHNFAK